MRKQTLSTGNQARKRNQTPPTLWAEQKRQAMLLAEMNYASPALNSVPLGYSSVPQVQRQLWATQIGQARGNRHLQRLLIQRQCACGGLAEGEGECQQCRQKRRNAQASMEEERGATVGLTVQRSADDAANLEEVMTDPAAVAPVPDVSGEGEPHEALAYAGNRRLRLRGVTRARFNGGSFRTENVITQAGSGCHQCRTNNCIHVTGTIAIEYHVATRVTLPRMPRGLSPCQRERVQEGIDNVLASHEQQHVAAFEQYNGTTTQPFDLTLCRNQFAAAIRAIVRQEEQPRRAAAQADSDSLDPFKFDVDLDCTEPSQPRSELEQGSPDEVIV